MRYGLVIKAIIMVVSALVAFISLLDLPTILVCVADLLLQGMAVCAHTLI
jgi:hypothetical protein